MGCYINPKGGDKEEWLARNAKPFDAKSLVEWEYRPGNTLVPIVLIDNGPFRAAAVLYSPEERERFIASTVSEWAQRGGIRPMTLWIAAIEHVRKVAPYDDYAFHKENA